MPNASNAADRIRSAHKQVSPVMLSNWLELIPWQVFATFTFPHSVTLGEANAKYASMIDSLERSMRTRICFVKSTETRSKHGDRVSRHHHAVLTAVTAIDIRQVTDTWNLTFGKTAADNCDLAMVEPFRSGIGGIAYVAKMMNWSDAELDDRYLERFLPGHVATLPAVRGASRLERRFCAQKAVVDPPPNLIMHGPTARPPSQSKRSKRERNTVMPLSFAPRATSVVARVAK